MSLSNFDVKQCGESKLAKDSISALTNITDNIRRDPFYGTDKCNRDTTEVLSRNKNKETEKIFIVNFKHYFRDRVF